MDAVERLKTISAPPRWRAARCRPSCTGSMGPDVLALEEIEHPVPGDEDVLVRVHAAGASIGDHHVVTGKPYLIRLTPFGGLPRPRNLLPGTAMAGRVEAVGAKVTTFRTGDEVFSQGATERSPSTSSCPRSCWELVETGKPGRSSSAATR
jgi:NADPH:quinone reductase-like Zn-dependent oxidoreductase